MTQFRNFPYFRPAVSAFGCSALIFGLGVARAQQGSAPNQDISVLHVQGNVYMLSGAGGNIAIQTGKDGVLLVDTGLAQNADRVLQEVKKLSNRPIRYIINTHVQADHIGGNEKIGAAGRAVVGGNFARDIGDDGRANIVAHENVQTRMSAPGAGQAPIPSNAWPSDTYFNNLKKMYFNGEGIELMHIANAHTDGDSLVYFRGSDVIAAGDVFVTTSFPVIDLERGGNIQGILDALNRIIEVSIPADRQEGGTYIIPGHGRIVDQSDIVEYRDMTTIIRDRIADLVKKGKTLAEVQASNPTFDYDPLYGKPGVRWTKTQFVEAVYKSLNSATDAKK